jgi:hypothetical protein
MVSHLQASAFGMPTERLVALSLAFSRTKGIALVPECSKIRILSIVHFTRSIASGKVTVKESAITQSKTNPPPCRFMHCISADQKFQTTPLIKHSTISPTAMSSDAAAGASAAIKASSIASTASASSPSKYYISITCIQVPAIRFPRFGWYSFPIVPQAKRTPGNVLTKTTMRNRINYTVTVWESRKHMLQFMRSGAHAIAMREERSLGIFAQTYGYEGDDVPEWDEAIQILHEKGRVHFDYRDKNDLSSHWTARDLTYLVATTAALVAVGLFAAKLHDLKSSPALAA